MEILQIDANFLYQDYIKQEDEDQQRLEALHQVPRLGLLFERTRKMRTEDVDFMLQLTDRIIKERDGD